MAHSDSLCRVFLLLVLLIFDYLYILLLLDLPLLGKCTMKNSIQMPLRLVSFRIEYLQFRYNLQCRKSKEVEVRMRDGVEPSVSLLSLKKLRCTVFRIFIIRKARGEKYSGPSGIAVVYEIYKVIGDYKNRPILTLYDFKSPNELFLPQVTICSENTLINYTKIRELKIHPQIVEFAKSTLSMNDKFTLGALNRAYGVKYPNYFSVFSEPTKDKARARLTKVLNKFSTNTTSDPALNAIFISLEAELISLFSNDTADVSDETDYFALHFESFLKYYDNDGEFDSWKFFRDNAFELEQVLPFCEFMNNILNCSDIVKPYLNYVAGAVDQCFLIDVNQAQTVREFGLKLIVNANSAFGNPIYHSIPEGFQIWIGKQYENSLTDTLRITSGTATSVFLKPTYYKLNINEGTGKCVNDVERMAITFPYSKSVCFQDCIIYYVMAFCNCSYQTPKAFLKPGFHHRACKTNAERDRCFLALQDDEGELGHNFRQCWTKCLPLCTYWDFFPTLTYNNLPNKAHVKGLLDSKLYGLDIEEFSKQQNNLRMDDLTVLEIRYADLTYVEVSQKYATTFDGFISQIGGLFGIFLGASLISVVQIVSFFCMQLQDIFKLCCTGVLSKFFAQKY